MVNGLNFTKNKLFNPTVLFCKAFFKTKNTFIKQSKRKKVAAKKRQPQILYRMTC